MYEFRQATCKLSVSWYRVWQSKLHWASLASASSYAGQSHCGLLRFYRKIPKLYRQSSPIYRLAEPQSSVWLHRCSPRLKVAVPCAIQLNSSTRPISGLKPVRMCCLACLRFLGAFPLLLDLRLAAQSTGFGTQACSRRMLGGLDASWRYPRSKCPSVSFA